MKWSQNLLTIGLLTVAALMLDGRQALAYTLEQVTKTLDGKCLRDADGLILAVKESKTLPGCIEVYCRAYEGNVFMQQSRCPPITEKTGCKPVEGAKDKIFPDCCAQQVCA